jgi:hypothetical protein
MEYCSHIWGGAPQGHLNLLDRIQNKPIRIINSPNLTDSLQPLAHRRAVPSLSLLYRYYSGQCSSELSTSIPSVHRPQRITRRNSSSHPHTLSVNVIKNNRHANSFLPSTVSLWNKLPPDVFPSKVSTSVFKCKVNRLDLLSFLA